MTASHTSLIEKFVIHDPVTAAGIIESMTPDEAAEILQTLAPEPAVRILKNLQVSFAAAILELTSEGFLKGVLSGLDPQLLASLLMYVPEAQRERIRRHVSGAIEEQIRELLEYPEGSVGRIVSTDFISFDRTVTAGAVIEKIRSLAKTRRPASYVYVVDGEKHLIGVLNMRDLMLADPDQSVEAVMHKDVFTLHCFTDVQEAAQDLSRRKYFAAPVVDSENRIVGIIKAERLIKGIQEDTVKDIQKLFGAGGGEKPFSTIFFSMKKRLVWLNINLVTAFMAAAVVALFEDVIARITILAVFLPVVAGQGGNAGAQSLAVVMRGIVMREIPGHRVKALILKEGILGAINGIVIGIVTAVVAWVWYGNPYLGVVIGLGMFFNLIFAGLAGASIPLAMKKIGIDPAQSSSIILTTVTDILGFFAFLGFALVFQNYLV